MALCPSCGEENPERAKFCLNCGASLTTSEEPPRDVRKTVTVLFSDVTGSTALGERLDPETLRRLMSRYFAEMKVVLERHGASVEKFIGDAVMAVFGVPVLHEDDALRACRAAVEMRDVLRELNKETERDLGVTIVTRTGVNSGEVVAGDPSVGQTLVTGDAVNTAARLEQAAPPGQVLIGLPTYRLVRDAVVAEPMEPVPAKGKADPVPAYQLFEVHPRALGHARRLDSPMVGRKRELELLLQAFERCDSERSCHMFTVLGSAGVGKSRLVEEFLKQVGDRGTVLRGRCLPYGEGITFWPIAEAVKQAAGIRDDDTPEQARQRIGAIVASDEHGSVATDHVAQVLGLIADSAVPEETFWAIRSVFEALALAGSVVLVLDDVHWGETTFLDLVEHIADWSREAPILLMCLARPELLDSRPGWGGGKMNASSILLEPLTSDEASTLIHNLVAVALPEEIGARITEAAEGNPLFVEEMLAMLIDEGALVLEDGRWAPARDLSAVAVPPSIHALLAARLDRLEDDQRTVIERASVVGKEFWRGAVVELSPEALRPAVPASLTALVRKDLIRPGRSSFAGEDAYRFRHLLVRDAAYESMPKETRAELHERFAAWLERAAGEGVSEFEEILAYHLEQAIRYRAELGPLDQRGVELSERAAERLASAGRRALARADMPAAESLLGRSVDLLPAGSPARGPLLVDLGEALNERGTFARAEEVFAEAAALAETLNDLGLAWRARLQRMLVTVRTDPSVTQASIARTIDRAIEELEGKGDDATLALAWHHRGLFDFWEGRCAKALQSLGRGRELARRAGDRRLEELVLEEYIGPLLWGPIPVQEALTMVRDIGEGTRNRRVEAFLLALQGYLGGLEGRCDDAGRHTHRALEILEDLGHRLHLAAARAQIAAETYEFCGDIETSVALQRAGIEDFERMEETGYLSTAAGYAANTMVTLRRIDEAERYVELCRRTAAEDDFSPQVLWRTGQGRLLSLSGRHGEAVALVREAVGIVEVTDSLVEHGNALLALADVLAAAGRSDEAASHVRTARELFERKGATVLVARARDRLGELGATA